MKSVLFLFWFSENCGRLGAYNKKLSCLRLILLIVISFTQTVNYGIWIKTVLLYLYWLMMVRLEFLWPSLLLCVSFTSEIPTAATSWRPQLSIANQCGVWILTKLCWYPCSRKSSLQKPGWGLSRMLTGILSLVSGLPIKLLL